MIGAHVHGLSAPVGVIHCMTPAEVAYTTALCQALSDGATQFLAGVKAAPDPRAPRAPGSWLNFAKQ